ncbi:MAG: SDR family oxidoreductase [Candidatus Krumholzibacteria bacterium]|nr:SDR family oxidoreductase [Candidatus Krumholzibacteria bacterium]
MTDEKVLLITGTRKGIGRFLSEYYVERGYRVVGCSRKPAEYSHEHYRHFCVDVADEKSVRHLFADIQRDYGRLDILINNAAIGGMNHALLTPLSLVERVMSTNVIGTFLFCREAAKLMTRNRFGRIVNFTTIAVPLKLEGEAVYTASKAAVVTLTEILAREFADLGITVNAVGPTPIETDLIGAVPRDKIDAIIQRQAIRRMGELRDVANVIDFFIRPESDFVTGQVLYLGGV